MARPLTFALVACSALLSACGTPSTGHGTSEVRLALPLESWPSQAPAIEEPATVPTVLGAVETREPVAGELDLSRVLWSVDEHSPLILAALEERALAEAEILGAAGGFDLKLKGKGGVRDGYYPNESGSLMLVQPFRSGGVDVFGGYRIGTGDFPVYDDWARTNEGGELQVGVAVPLLQGREVDSRRVAEWQAKLSSERAEPEVLRKRIEVHLKATSTYWKWVASGRKLALAESLLALAETRMDQVTTRVEEGQLAPIAVTENRRSIVDRNTKLIAAQQALERAAIELSLYLRDGDGWPRVPQRGELPAAFPTPSDAPEDDELEDALARRPDLAVLEYDLERLRLELELANNKTLPDLDLQFVASQDLGAPTDPKDSLGPFDWKAGIALSVPLQRRSARGKVAGLEAKLRKAERELQFARDVALAEVEQARSRVDQARDQLGQATENVTLTEQLVDAERLQVEAGESDLFRLNLREQQLTLAVATRIEVLEAYFRAEATYLAATGRTALPGLAGFGR